MTWLYFSGLVLLLGAVVNAVIAGRTADDDATVPDGVQPAADHDTEAVHAEARALQRERERLDRRHAEIMRDRSEPDRDRSRTGGNELEDDTEALRRQNRALRDRLRWYEKPVWKRGVLWMLGYRLR